MTNEIVPLSADLELAPVRGTPTSLERCLGPLLERAADDFLESTARLRRLAKEAEQSKNLAAEAAIAHRLAGHSMRVINLFQAANRADEMPNGLRSSDIPRWDEIPARAREHFEKGFEAMKIAE